ncbi:hypothetical protein [Chondromyces apiculatus]|uniref:Uncharacterized protein n=1 Tax=Chondromyces apiculatus DSM 436 TaxID=1192034 RepID=A0A017SZS5_9BACT|nr:hypothetical protein [Chondromyces apiculatus]EYF02473.1 Hypothetical protein CAP_7095 [Chondromyces apiculatus DSM 436]
MSSHDVLDENLAQQFLWRISIPDLVALKEARPKQFVAQVQVREAPAGEVRARWERVGRDCADLAQQVARAWEMAGGARQAAATGAMLSRVRRMGFDVIGMSAHPEEILRLWRLVARHHGALPRKGRKDGIHALSFVPIPTESPEMPELLVEAAIAGDEWLAFLLEQSLQDENPDRRYPGASARLAEVLDVGPTWRAQAIAGRLLFMFGEVEAAIPALRRALRRPHAGVRTIAIEALLERAPEALTADDVQWLLEDAVKHPPPPGRGTRSLEMIDEYGQALIAAVGRVRPPEGFRPLGILADGGGLDARGQRAGLDAGWAIRALAAGYPERAVLWIDRALYGSRSWRRYDAVEAAGALPEELARPRLLEAAAGPGRYPVERAQALWMERFGESCPVDPLAGLCVEILAAPPSEKLLGRLSVLRSGPDEARGRMLEALLAEAPVEALVERSGANGVGSGASGANDANGGSLDAEARETLALLVFNLRDPAVSPRVPELPVSEEAWAELLLRRFGAAAFEGLAALALRGARVGADHEWLEVLAGLDRKGLLCEAFRERLRQIAREALTSPRYQEGTGPLFALSCLGAPADLADRLWHAAVERTAERASCEDEGRSSSACALPYGAYWAGEALAKVKGAPGLEARIAEEGEAALRAGDHRKLERIVRIGCQRRTPVAAQLGQRLLDGVDAAEGSVEAAVLCGYALHAAGKLDTGWVLAALRAPESLRFSVAARLCKPEASAEVVALLSATLGSKARGGAAAAEAAAALLSLKALAVEDSRLDGILREAAGTPAARSQLAGLLLRLGAPFAQLKGHFLELLVGVPAAVSTGNGASAVSAVSAAGAAAVSAYGVLTTQEPEGLRELLGAAWTAGPHPEIRQRLGREIGELGEAERYWCHDDEDETVDPDDGCAFDDEDELDLDLE